MISIEKITKENVENLKEKELINIKGKKEMIISKPKKQGHIVIETIRKQRECMEKCTYVFYDKKGLTLFRYRGYSQEVCEYNGLKEKILNNSNKIPWEQL